MKVSVHWPNLLLGCLVLAFLSSCAASPRPHEARTTHLTPCDEAVIAEVLTSEKPRKMRLAACGPEERLVSLETLIREANHDVRRELLNRTGAWYASRFTPFQVVLFFILLMLPLIGMTLAYAVGEGKWGNFPGEAQTVDGEGRSGLSDAWRFVIGSKVRAFRTLLRRDLGPLSFDVSMHQDRAEITEYRGALHWFRDVAEKLLAFSLVLGFFLFLTKLLTYFWWYASGEGWRLVFLPIDINIAITLAGLALVIDGFVIISTMTDAPGIGRTLDAVIVILAGYVVMLVEAQPGDYAVVSFTVGHEPWLAPTLALVIGILFVIRWIVRHHTVQHWRGHHPADGDGNANH